jgi:predicted DNA-binding transcriptional regulator YafY
MSFSKNVKVLSPEKLKKEVLDSAKEILKSY